MAFELQFTNPNFGWVLFSMSLTALQVVWTGFAIGRLRREYFDLAFFEKNFPDLVTKEKKYPNSGYPDMGNGRFAAKLNDDQWMKFNNAQRAHYNYVEGAASALALQLISGLFFPRWSALLGFVYIVGRELYSWGYRTKGARGRSIGAGLLDVALVLQLLASLYGSYNLGGGCAGLSGLIFG